LINHRKVSVLFILYYNTGNNYPSRILKEQGQSNIEFLNEEFVVKLKSSKNSKRLIERLYENWLKDQAESAFKDKIEKYSKQVGVKAERIFVKKLRNR
jgi:predicted metal-dependent hydrolase